MARSSLSSFAYRWLLPAIVCACALLLAWPLAARQSKPRVRGHTYAESPVTVRQPTVLLVEMFTAPHQYLVSGEEPKLSRVRYANRPPTQTIYVLEGQLLCRNRSGKAIEVIGLTIVPMNAFQQPILPVSRHDSTHALQVVVNLPDRAERRISWKQQVSSADVYEVGVVVTHVRFTDGEVWQAPPIELVDVF